MISIVIPLYNKAHTIERTLKTVLNQSFNDFEIVIIDDGSTDGGADAINKFSQDSRIRIIRQDNQGASAARNNGVINSKFEYIAFLDGDDEWLPNYLYTMKDAIDKFPDSEMFCCAGIVRNDDGCEYLRLASKFKNQICKINFFENPHVFLHTSATIISKKIFYKSTFFPVGMKRNEDYAFFFSIALLTPVVYCGIPLTVYVGGVEGQATSVNVSIVLNHVVNRYNHVFENWDKTGRKNKFFKIFTKYELRHFFICYLRDRDYQSFFFLLNNIDQSYLKIFSKIEIVFLKNRFFRKLGIIYLLITKIRWRFRGYPRINYL